MVIKKTKLTMIDFLNIYQIMMKRVQPYNTYTYRGNY